MGRRLTTTEFTARGAIVHEGKYDYSKVIYKNSKTKVCMICPKHGEFWQSPSDHLQGHGCIACARIIIESSRRSNTKEFITRANIKHQYYYDYSNVVYENCSNKVNIGCPIHGEFWQTPHGHLLGYGCAECGLTKNCKRGHLWVACFLTQGKEKYNNMFAYPDSGYRNRNDRISIWCKKHKIVFKQSADKHLSDSGGCPKCIASAAKEIKKKECSACGRLKNKSEFYSGNAPDGKSVRCMDCIKNYQQSLAGYESYGHQVLPEDKATDINGILFVKCKHCHILFPPTVSACRSRIRTTRALGNGESNFYCSDKCKGSCVVFNFKPRSTDPRSKLFIEKEKRSKTRTCQTDHLKQLQCDEVGHNYCEKCGDIIDVDLHHTQPVGTENSISSAGHILLCPGCHVELHAECK